MRKLFPIPNLLICKLVEMNYLMHTNSYGVAKDFQDS